ncbi:hypothetical protein BURKHO8Y_220049 [Burkholderia sp. 8Y]|nr:hypothetical protein BURKHO8Y_220049 [Burkholderia sp. 8Y]
MHLIRNSLTLASWKDRKPLAAAIKPIYQPPRRRQRRSTPLPAASGAADFRLSRRCGSVNGSR